MNNNCLEDFNTKGRFSQSTIDAINRLEPQILAAHGVIRHVPGKTAEYVCIFCNNGGNGNPDATGIKPLVTASHVGWKCHRCGEKFNNLKIFATHYGLNAITDFQQLVEKICADFNISCEKDADNFNRDALKKPEMPPEIRNLINQDLATDKKALKDFCSSQGGLWRGLPFEILEKFGCRYIRDWTPPTSRATQKFSTPSPRVLIPASRSPLKANYLARLTCSLDSFDLTAQKFIKEKQHAGTKTLFNADALKEKTVLAFEGYIDALSAIYAGFHAVATGGATSYQLLVDALKNLSQMPYVVIMFDPNKAGRDNAQKLKTELDKIGCISVIRFLTNDVSDLDANDILVKEGVDALRSHIQGGCRADFETVEKEIAAIEEKISAENGAQIVSTDDFNGYDYLQGDNNDLPNARRLEKFRGKYFRWLKDDEIWLLYDNGIWLRRSEKNSVLYPVAASFADKMKDFAQILTDKFKTLKQPTIIHSNFADKTPEEKIYDKAKADKDKAFKISGYFQKRKNYNASIDLLKGSENILITAADLNAHKNLLCCADCVVDLQTGKTYDFAPEFLITNQTRAAYNKFIDAEADAFVRKVLADILLDLSTRRAVLLYLGYGLTGERNYQISQFWRGSGANGKSTILDTLKELLGSYVVKLPCAALLASSRPIDGNAATPALALLDGDIRLAIVDELPQKSRLDAALYKTLVTDKTVTGRQLHCNFRDIFLRAKLILNGNFLPSFNANDKATRRRINVVEFTQSFEGDRADKNLLNKLANPYAQCAFLRILVAHSQEFYREGLFESNAMKQAKAEYISESDFISEFADEKCIQGDGSIPRKEFISRLKAEYPTKTSLFISNKQLFKAIYDTLKPRGVDCEAKDGHNNNIFKGIRWRQPPDDFDGEILSPDDYPPT